MVFKKYFRAALLVTSVLPVAFSVHAQEQDDDSAAAKEVVVGLEQDNLAANAKMRPLVYEEREEGLKKLLEHCARNAAQNLGVAGGFSNNPDVRIEMPSAYKKSGTFLFRDEESGSVDGFFRRLNQAAEGSIPKVAGYFIVAISQLRDKDVIAVSDNEDDRAATFQLHRRMSKGLIEVVRPVIKASMEEKGLKRIYMLKSSGAKTPATFDAENYLIEQVLEVFFTLMSEEEQTVRQKRTECSEDIICWYIAKEAPVEKDL